MSWQDRDHSQILQEEMVSEYPFIQYVNDGGSLEPREATGGFAMSAEQAELLKATPNGGVEHTLIFSTGESEVVFFTDWLRFVPLATRFAWVNRHAPGLDALICNPKLVETGLDLVHFSTVVFFEMDYDYLTLKLVTGPGDHGEPMVTIMLPDES